VGGVGGGEGQGGRDVSEKCANSTMRAYICIAGSIPMGYTKLLRTNRAVHKRKAAARAEETRRKKQSA
jgi:hypothetical protein